MCVEYTRRIRQCKSRVGGVSRTGGSKGLAVCQVVWNVAKFFFNPFTRSNFRFFLSLSTFWNFPHLLKAKRTHENSHERSLSTWRKFLNLLKSTVRSRPFEIFRLDPHSGTPCPETYLCSLLSFLFAGLVTRLEMSRRTGFSSTSTLKTYASDVFDYELTFPTLRPSQQGSVAHPDHRHKPVLPDPVV